MALRRDVIAQMGGFDPAFRFYLDETDVNFRLMYAGLSYRYRATCAGTSWLQSQRDAAE